MKMTKNAKVAKRPTTPRGYKPPYPFQEVIWDDAASNSESWVGLNDIAPPEQVITRGFLVKETAKAVSLAASVSNEEAHEEVVGNTMTIPKGMIVSRRTLNLSTARPSKSKATKAEPPKENVEP